MFEPYETHLPLDLTASNKEALAKQQVRAEEIIILESVKGKIGPFCINDLKDRLSKIVPVDGGGVEHYLLDGENLVSFGPYYIEPVHIDGGYQCRVSRKVTRYKRPTNSPAGDEE